ncbi:MAG TPA: hypothetical protein P5121_18350 [Caldilineaceae bacterium]|nr:hypothetical protein [Caldilineaceae bacterium]
MTDIDIDSYWEYGDPAASEALFRSLLSAVQGDARLELLTQIARTYSLRGQFVDAHRLLDEVAAQLPGAGARPHVRYRLEQGRTFNSSGETEPAREQFMAAWEQAAAAELVGLAVDAAHMLAITYTGTPTAIDWNQRGLALARSATDPKAQELIPAMLNNSAWDLHDMGRLEEALLLFTEAQEAWTARAKPQRIRVAKWSVARCLRSLGRYEDALQRQLELAADYRAAKLVDGYVYEEIAENLEALGRVDEARPYFAQAFVELGKDAWFVQHEAARLASLHARAELE